MGLFSFIGDALGWVAEKAWDAVDYVRDKIGTILDIFSEKVASENSYDITNSNVYTTERLNSILIEFADDYMENAAKIEENCIKAVEEYYDQFLSVVEKNQNIGYSKSAIRKLKANKLKMRKDITNSIRDPLKRRLSLDDSECLRILKMDSGTKKKKKMADFAKKAISEALDNLADMVKETVDMQLKELEEGFNEVAEKQEKEFATLKGYMDRFANLAENDIKERERNCIIPLFVLESAEEILQLIG
ncbi:MAG: hypothetical protein HFH13_06930 [Dorea sp.]|jgi:hypothetical protein|nr:hypothetical protein [Dorea sp.]